MELHEAVKSKCLPRVTYLLDQGVDINFQNRKHKTVLHIAIEQNSIDLVNLLLRRGPNVNVKDNIGNSPLHYARSETMIEDLVHRDANVNARNKYGQTPLYTAINSSNELAVSTLLELGASMNIEDENGITPLHAALLNRNLKIMKTLIINGADVEGKTASRETPLVISVEKHFDAELTLLLDFGASVNVGCIDGKVPLHWALKNRNLKVMEELLDRGTDIESINEWDVIAPSTVANSELLPHTVGDIDFFSEHYNNSYNRKLNLTPIYAAAYNNFESEFVLLLNRGADFNKRVVSNYSVLEYVVGMKNINLFKELLSKGADLNITQKNGNTIFFNMVENGFVDAVELALKTTDVKLKLGNGRTALHTGCTNKRIVDLLVAHGVDLEARDEHGQTPLLYARHLPYDIFISTVPLLVQKCANVRASDNQGYTILHVPNISKDLLELLLNKGADPNAQECTGRTPLHVGCRNSSTIELLVAHGADLEVRDENGQTPLLYTHHLAYDRFIRTVPLLVHKGANVRASDNQGNTILHVPYIKEDLLELLLKTGANPNARNSNGRTPLHVGYINTSTIDLLVAHGADLEVRDKNGQTPLLYTHHLTYDRFIRTVPLLVHKGANVRASDNLGNTILHVPYIKEDLLELLLKSGANPNARNSNGRTPLHVGYINSSTIDLLVAHGADLEVRDENGQTPLLYTHHLIYDRFIHTVPLLVNKGANVRASDNLGNTILHNPSIKEDLLELLLKNGANPNARNSNGRTPLHVHCHTSRIVSLLVAHGADLEARDKDGQTPLLYARHLSCKMRTTISFLVAIGANVKATDNKGKSILHDPNIQRYFLKFLLNKGADPNAQDINGKTPLHLVENMCHFEALLAKGANIDIEDCEGKTPFQSLAINNVIVDHDVLNTKTLLSAVAYKGNTLLHLASSRSCETLVSYLLEQGANVNATNERGDTPLHLAVTINNHKIVAELLRRGASVNKQNANGTTPLHLAGYDCNVIKELLVRGARVDIEDINHKTPLSISKFPEEFEEILLKHVVILKMSNLREHFMCNVAVDTDRFSDFKASCAEELGRMKANKFGYVSMFHILSQYKDPVYVSNTALAQKIKSPTLQHEYPIYSLLLKAMFEMAEKRKLLLDKVIFNVSVTSETTLENVELPLEIKRKILSELTNEDLESVIEAEE